MCQSQNINLVKHFIYLLWWHICAYFSKKASFDIVCEAYFSFLSAKIMSVVDLSVLKPHHTSPQGVL